MFNRSRSNSEISSKVIIDGFMMSVGICSFSFGIVNDIEEAGKTSILGRKVDCSAGGNIDGSKGRNVDDSSKLEGKVPIVKRLIGCSVLSA